MSERNDYLAFLVRLQRGQNQRYWRASLQDVHTQEVWHFANEHELIRHLLAKLTQAAAQNVRHADRGDVEAT